MIKIVKTFSRLDPGGAETRTLQLIEEINRNNTNEIEFHILCLSGEKGTLDSSFLEQGVKLHYMKLKKITFLPNFIKLTKKEKFNVIHSNTFLFSGFFMLLGKFLKIPVRISHIRTLFDEKENSFRKIRNSILKKMIFSYSSLVIGVNEAVLKNNFKEYHGKAEKFRILYNGISPNLPTRTDIEKSDEINFIHIGRQVNAKNHKKLILVFIEINRMYPNSCLTLVGKIDEKIMAGINDLLNKHSLTEKVKFLGVQSDINKILQNKNLLIFPSIREGLPGVVLEALSNGVPVLASDIDPHKEISDFIHSVEVLPLEASNIEWAEVALKICSNYPTLNNRITIHEFNKSPFILNKHFESYMNIINQLNMGNKDD